VFAAQAALGAVAVKLALPAWTVELHFGTAMLLLATLLVAARGRVATPTRRSVAALALGFVTLVFGGLTANLGAATACLGFPLCNGQLLPQGNYLQHIHWAHRVLAVALAGYVAAWALTGRARGARVAFALIVLQFGVAAAMVLDSLPRALQAAHAALGTGIWAALVLAAV
jgi:heme A synthase